MLPTGEHLKPGKLPGAQNHQRLKEWHELVLFKGPGKASSSRGLSLTFCRRQKLLEIHHGLCSSDAMLHYAFIAFYRKRTDLLGFIVPGTRVFFKNSIHGSKATCYFSVTTA